MSLQSFTPCYDGPVDSGPRRDVRRGDAVGRLSEVARHASELVFRRPVLLVHRPALRAHSGRVPGVHEVASVRHVSEETVARYRRET